MNLYKALSVNKGILFASLAVVLWGFLGIFIKNIEYITPLGMVSIRLFLGALILLILLLSRKESKNQLFMSIRYYKFYSVIAAIMGVHFTWATLGYHHTTVANAAILTNTMPIFVPVLAIIFLREKVRTNEALGILISFFGIFIIFFEKEMSFDSTYFQGNLWALLAAILLSIYTIVARKNSNFSPLITIFWMCFLGSIGTALVALSFSDPMVVKVTIRDSIYMLGLALVGTFGHFFYFKSLNYIKATTASSIAMASPVVAMIYASFFLSESYSFINLIGISICLFGIALSLKKHKLIEN